MSITLKPKRVVGVLVVVMGVLLLAHIVSALIRWNIPIGEGFPLALAFDLDQEVSIPTWFSQLLLFLAALTALWVALSQRATQQRYYRYWYGIAALLLLMSVDEGSSLHELAAAPIGHLLVTEGTWLYFAWVLVGLGLVLGVALVYLRFWWRLPLRTRMLVLVAAITYVIGSIGLEIVGGYVISNQGVTVTYMILTGIEETLEMTGTLIVIYAFLDYLRRTDDRSSINIT